MFSSATYTLREPQFSSLCQKLLVDGKTRDGVRLNTFEACGVEWVDNRKNNHILQIFSTTSMVNATPSGLWKIPGICCEETLDGTEWTECECVCMCRIFY